MILSCKHRSKPVGVADAKCGGMVNLYECKLLSLFCIAHPKEVYKLYPNSQPPITDPPLYCPKCIYNTSGQTVSTIPDGCK